MAPARALIVGADGQDGRILSSQLQAAGARCAFWSRAGYQNDLSSEKASLSITDLESVKSVLKQGEFDEIYFLAAAHHSSAESELPFSAYLETNVVAPENFLRAIVDLKKRPRFFFASSCHVFGEPEEMPQTELSALKPNSFYGITKVATSSLCEFYRQQGVFAAVGILYNHESSFRKPAYFTKRFSRELAEMIKGKRTGPVRVGNLKSVVDWSDARDTTRAMQAILKLDAPDTFIIASGVPRTIGDWVQTALKHAKLEFNADTVAEEPSLARNLSKCPYVGNATKLMRASGWKPEIAFETLVQEMLDYELNQLK